MLLFVVSWQVVDSVVVFLWVVFLLNSLLFNGENNDNVLMLEQFLVQFEMLLKGLYFFVQLLFCKSDLLLNFFFNLMLLFLLYVYQVWVFQCLGSDVLQLMLVVIGIGFGKIECFMFLLFNYCVGVL